MKKFLALILAVAMLATLCACGNNADNNNDNNAPAETLKFGFGVAVSASGKDAVDDKAASGKLDVTYAAVLVDANGKITACELDALSMSTSFKDGIVTPVVDKELTTKYEQGDAYGMSAIGKVEWNKQADAFLKLVPGKTLAEVEAMVVNGYQGNDDVIAAGCTIGVNDFVIAIKNAHNNAKTDVAANAKLSVAGAGEQKAKNVDDNNEKASNQLTANICGAAKDTDGKILAITSDCVAVTFTADAEGKVSKDVDSSKRQQGDAYGMKSEYGSKREWYEHANAFDAACVGKTADKVAELMGADFKGVDSLQAAGCTIFVSGFVKAASKL